MMIPRQIQPYLERCAREFPVVTVVGPRQAGKTTLVRQTFPEKPYRSLENPDVRAYAAEDPRGFLGELPEGAILDEIQRLPSLLSYLPQIVDESGTAGRFVLTGSQHFLMMESVTQSLAGRTAILTLLPLSVAELGPTRTPPELNDLIRQGLYPRIYDRPIDAYTALRDYFQTYVERDVRQLLKVQDMLAFETFVRLCAGRIGQLLNLQLLAGDAGLSTSTAKAWMALLEASFVVFRLPPWRANIGKRLIKTPKLYFHDVGLASYLCGIETSAQLVNHPLRGPLFENLVVTELLKGRLNQGRDGRLHFYRDRTGHEIDVLLPDGPAWIPLEIKAGQTVSGEWFQAFGHFAALAQTPVRPGIVVYGGREVQRRQLGTACGIRDLAQTLATITP